jgi:GT2 family glycosyltransferase
MSGAIAVVMVSYRTGPVLFDAIDAALRANGVSQVVLVDNGNPAEVEARLDARAAAEPRLVVLRGHGNVGFAHACNLGTFAAPGAAWLMFLNPDAVLEPGAAEALVVAGEGRRRPWIVGARILGADGREQRGARRRAPTLARALGALIGGRADRMHLEDAPAPEGPIAVDAVSGAGLLLRADDFVALGGFDESYFLHVEDLDLCRRAQLDDGEVVFVPTAVVRHVGATSDASALFVEWCKGRGLARYLVRFAPDPISRGLALLAGPLIVAAAVARGVLRGRARARPDRALETGPRSL